MIILSKLLWLQLIYEYFFSIDKYEKKILFDHVLFLIFYNIIIILKMS